MYNLYDYNAGSKRVLLLWVLVAISICDHAQRIHASGIFATEKMAEVKLEGLQVRLGRPIQVTAQRAWRSGSDGPWAFIHPVPAIARFPTGELMVTYSLVADTNEEPLYLRAFQISKDGGKTWGHRYDLIPDHQPWIYFPQADGSLLAIPSHFYQSDSKDRHNLHAPYCRFEQGGDRLIFEPGGTRIVDLPWAVDMFPSRIPRTNWIARTKLDGNAYELEGKLFVTGYLSTRSYPEILMSNLLFVSEDRGRTWRYFSTISDPAVMPDSPKRGANGPSETALIQLEDGDLMAVFRVGSGLPWYLHRAYSSDGGRNWTKAEPIPAYSVEPSMLRIANGTIVISTGRPGIWLWLSTDHRGESWQSIDITEHHNGWAPDATYRIGSYAYDASTPGREGRTQTSAYTEMVEVSPNRLLLVYDRGAKPQPAHEGDFTRIFVLPIEVQRK